MSVKTDLWDYLDSIGQATDVFIGGLPDTPDNVVVLEQYEGLGALYVHDVPGPAYARPSIQARARSFDPVWAEDRVNYLFKNLSLTNVVLNGTKYQRVWALSSPMYLGLDEAKRHHWSVNFGIHKEA